MRKLLAVILCALLLLTAACGASDQAVLTVSGDGLSEPAEFTLAQLKKLDDRTLNYSTVNNFPSTKYVTAEGCSLAALLEACGVGDDITQITVTADDGYQKTFSREQLLGEARFYDLGGNPTPVEAMIAWAFSDDADRLPESAEALEDLRLVFGQRGPHDPNSAASVQHVTSIQVSSEPLSRLEPCGFRETEDGLLELTYEDMDRVKIYYTLDGSDPDPETSPVYNPSTSNFQPELNVPLKLSPGVTVRAMVVGFGYIDSEISEYVVE